MRLAQCGTKGGPVAGMGAELVVDVSGGKLELQGMPQLRKEVKKNDGIQAA